MSAVVTSTTEGVVVIQISGVLKHAEFAATHVKAAAAIKDYGTISMLIVAEDFKGWEKHSGWNDISFTMQNDKFIKKIGIVGEEKWRDFALVFTAKGIRKVAIEYFTPDQFGRAYAWVTAK